MDAILTTRGPIPLPPSELLNLRPHSCTWCRKVVIDPGAAVKLDSHTRGNTVEFKIHDIHSARGDGCPIFIPVYHDMDSCDNLTSDTVTLLIELRYTAVEPSDDTLYLVRVSGHMKASKSTPDAVESYVSFSKGSTYGVSVQDGE